MPTRLELIEQMIRAGSKDPFVWYARAMEYRTLGQNDQALSCFDEVARQFCDYVPTYLMAAQTAQLAGQTNAARAWCERGLKVAQSRGDAHALSELNTFMSSLTD